MQTCIPYTGHIDNKGYGQWPTVAFGTRLAHRITWMQNYGNPGKLFVLHTCDNPICINLEHLFLGTNADNMLDKKLKQRATKHGLSKLAIDEILSKVESISRYADKFNVSFQAVKRIQQNGF